jgi:DNA-binding GntR family transcriptional regulator
VAEPQQVAELGSRPIGLRPVAHRSLVDLVLDEIRRSILDRSLVPGASVSIAELSDRLGVSHIPVREALRRVEAEGLIQLRHGRSARVAPMSRHDLVEVFRLRELVEADAFARAVRVYSDDDLAAIEQAWDDLLVRPEDDPEAIFLRHHVLHQLLVGPAAGDWDRRLLEMLWRAAERYVALLIIEYDVTAPRRMREAHRGLVEAAATRSPQEARKAIRDHAETAIEVISEILDSKPVEAKP